MKPAIDVAGLEKPVEIFVDYWGIPHIYAESSHDAFFAQGFNAARARLWQLDLWRRAGLGRLAEVLGPRFVERDRAARLLLYRGDTSDEWSNYGPRADTAAKAFVDGINEYVRQASADEALLPAEFRALDYLPAAWAIEDLLRVRAPARYRNAKSEAARARLYHLAGPTADRLRLTLEPATAPHVAEGMNFSVFAEDVLRPYLLATAELGNLDEGLINDAPGGSNNWALAGSRTASGWPLLANDPHRALTVPSLRYFSHLECPEFSLIGAGEATAPGVVFGHNGRLAFGITIAPVDQEDLYVYEINHPGGSRYRYQSGWEEMEFVSERIEVRGEDDVEISLAFTRHGPVLHHSDSEPVAVALRAAWLEPGMGPYLANLGFIFARRGEEFREAARSWKTPGENLLYADDHGEIGWVPAAAVPIRPNWDGLLPVPGDGRYEWTGFQQLAELAGEVGPRRGWIATANACNLQADLLESQPITYEWEPPFRQQRIEEALSASSRVSVSDAVALQTDVISIPAREICLLLEHVDVEDEVAQEGLNLLADWDARLLRDSPAAALFEVWLRHHLRPAVIERELAAHLAPTRLAEALPAVLTECDSTADNRVVLALCRALAQTGELAEVVQTTLRSAMEELREISGSDSRAWAWGDLHRARLSHPLGWRSSSLPAVPRGGSGDTVGCTGFEAEGFGQMWGASARVAIDVGDWDQSLAVNAPGQEGRSDSPHFADLHRVWANDGAVPLLYSRKAIQAFSSVRLVLQPRHSQRRLRGGAAGV